MAETQQAVRALYAYDAQHLDELTLQPGMQIRQLLFGVIYFFLIQGDILVMIERRLDGWCRGNLNGRIGLFPGNYVEEI